jgi:hypothetical protein
MNRRSFFRGLAAAALGAAARVYVPSVLQGGAHLTFEGVPIERDPIGVDFGDGDDQTVYLKSAPTIHRDRFQWDLLSQGHEERIAAMVRAANLFLK